MPGDRQRKTLRLAAGEAGGCQFTGVSPQAATRRGSSCLQARPGVDKPARAAAAHRHNRLQRGARRGNRLQGACNRLPLATSPGATALTTRLAAP
ncbi:hypothetical protein BHE74_00058551 [Ensete ventricosum]|nr:hypothetical protein BHE74_00058551 [Ensete ventricosum]